MNRILTLSAIVLTMSFSSAIFAENSADASQKDYEISINGKSYDISLNEENIIAVNPNQKLKVILKKKDIVEFSDTMVSFKHKSSANIASTELGSGVSQLMITSAVGTIFIIQEYTSLNPSGIVDIMVQELIKQDISYGYKSTEEAVTFTTSDNKEMKGKKVTLSYNNEKKIYEVLAYGSKDIGFLLVTGYNMDFIKQDRANLDLMLSTIKIKF